jgi:hypothetical protein
MPAPGEPCPGFIAERGRCWQMVYSRQMQATHCHETPSWTGRWFSPKGDHWWQVVPVGLREPPGRADGAQGLCPTETELANRSPAAWTVGPQPQATHRNRPVTLRHTTRRP